MANMLKYQNIIVYLININIHPKRRWIFVRLAKNNPPRSESLR